MSACKSLAAGIILLVLGVGNSNATYLTLDQWHLNTDNDAGLHQSAANASVFYAASANTNLWSETNTYEIQDGYHWATYAEWAALVGTASWSDVGYAYYDEAGWSGYYWEGQNRYFLTFADSATVRKAHHTGTVDSDYYVSSSGNSWYNYLMNYHTNWAGLVLVKDEESTTTVPEPASIFLIGLGLAGLGFAHRKKAA